MIWYYVSNVFKQLHLGLFPCKVIYYQNLHSWNNWFKSDTHRTYGIQVINGSDYQSTRQS